MDTKLYLTPAAVVAILYALAFLVIPVQASLFFILPRLCGTACHHISAVLRFCGAAIFGN